MKWVRKTIRKIRNEGRKNDETEKQEQKTIIRRQRRSGNDRKKEQE
jgi:hypothetical protein